MATNARSGENLINGMIKVAPECWHALVASLAELEEIVHKNIGEPKGTKQGTI